jgi:precorrin-2 dehydrogenase/sirohydrochlorin ferrochelatase
MSNGSIEERMIMAYYPVFLDLRRQVVLIIGGGEVAERKTASLLRCGARVHLAAKTLTSSLEKWKAQGRIQYLGEEYKPSFMDEAFMVIAATDDAGLNQLISKEAKRRGLLINAVDQPEDCSFIVPSVLNRGDLTIAISTSGRSPALAKKIRKELEASYGEEYEVFLNLLGKVRTVILRQGRPAEENKVIFQKIIASSLLESLKAGDWERAASSLGNVLGMVISAEDIRSYIHGD